VVWSATADEAAAWKGRPDLARHLSELLERGPEPLGPWLPPPARSPPAGPLRDLARGAEKLLGALPAAASLACLGRRPFEAPPRLVRAASPVFAFPLRLRHADRYAVPRLALAGDAARTVPPLAGQGLNLGVQDAAALAGAVADAAAAGMDPSAFLASYDSRRRSEAAAAVGGIHAVRGLFGLGHGRGGGGEGGPFLYLKALGMAAIQSSPPLRRELVRAACLGLGGRR
jgi:2-polyprenyl-6-methoxyphenol hydroxylase-like FAD-dependent oxidoreductase